MKVYFPNLDSFRIIAATLVFIHHEEMIRYYIGLENAWNQAIIRNLGKYGVIMFFVLSGYLITRLLLDERRLTGKIDIRKFYIRRILRIWPLYYLCYLLFVLIAPLLFTSLWPSAYNDMEGSYFQSAVMNLILMPNVAYVFIAAVPFFTQAWSIGVEEQFYIAWPLMLSKFRKVGVLTLIVAVAYVMLKGGLLVLRTYDNSALITDIYRLVEDAKIYSMAIGGFAATLSLRYERHKMVNMFLHSRPIEIGVLMVTIMAFTNPEVIPFWNYYKYEVVTILFAFIINSAATSKGTIFKLEYRWLSYLGRVSYGFYMYHIFVIYVGYQILPTNSWLLQYPLAYLATIFVSALSYEYFEKYFVYKKSKYSIIQKT